MEQKIIKSNTLIIGGAKCGTSTLASILSEHSDICLSTPKEPNFFQDHVLFKENDNYLKGNDWYSNCFSHYNGEKIILDASPSYSDVIRNPKTVKRMYDYNKDFKIIYIVREPLEKQISTWKMQYADSVNNGTDFFEFEWASQGFTYWMAKQKENKQWTTCLYQKQVDAYLNYFSKEQILVLFLEDWVSCKEKELDKITSFLDIEGLTMKNDLILNSANSKNKQNFIVKTIRNSKTFGLFTKMIPKSVKKHVVDSLEKKIEYPEMDYSDCVIEEFNDYVRADYSEFLNNYKL